MTKRNRKTKNSSKKSSGKIKKRQSNKKISNIFILIPALCAILLALFFLRSNNQEPITVACDVSDFSDHMSFTSYVIGTSGQSYENQDWSIQLDCDRSFLFEDERWGANRSYYKGRIDQAEFDNFLRLYQEAGSLATNRSCTYSDDTNGRSYGISAELGDYHIQKEWDECPSTPEPTPGLYKDIESEFISIVPDFPY